MAERLVTLPVKKPVGAIPVTPIPVVPVVPVVPLPTIPVTAPPPKLIQDPNTGKWYELEDIEGLVEDPKVALNLFKEGGFESLEKYYGRKFKEEEEAAVIEATKEFEEDHVKLKSGEYVTKADYEALSEDERAQLMDIGIQRFNLARARELELAPTLTGEEAFAELKLQGKIPKEAVFTSYDPITREISYEVTEPRGTVFEAYNELLKEGKIPLISTLITTQEDFSKTGLIEYELPVTPVKLTMEEAWERVVEEHPELSGAKPLSYNDATGEVEYEPAAPPAKVYDLKEVERWFLDKSYLYQLPAMKTALAPWKPQDIFTTPWLYESLNAAEKEKVLKYVAGLTGEIFTIPVPAMFERPLTTIQPYAEAMVGPKVGEPWSFEQLKSDAITGSKIFIPAVWAVDIKDMKLWQIAVNAAIDLAFVGLVVGPPIRAALRPTFRATASAAKVAGTAQSGLKTVLANLRRVEAFIPEGTGSFATRLKAAELRGAKLPISSRVYASYSREVQRALQASIKADKAFIDTLANLKKIRPGELAKFEKLSGMKGLKKTITDVNKATSALDKAWRVAESYPLGSEKYIKATQGTYNWRTGKYTPGAVTKAQAGLEEALTAFYSKTKPRSSLGPYAGWDNAIQAAERELFEAQKAANSAAAAASRAPDVKSLRLWAQDATIDLRNAEIKLANIKTAAAGGREFPPAYANAFWDELEAFLKAKKPLPPERLARVEAIAKEVKERVKPWELTPERQAEIAAAAERARVKPEGVPTMITRQMESQLKALGYKQAYIDKLTPREAWDILKPPSPPPRAPPKAPPPTPKVEPTAPPKVPVAVKERVKPMTEEEFEALFRSEIKPGTEVAHAATTKTRLEFAREYIAPAYTEYLETLPLVAPLVLPGLITPMMKLITTAETTEVTAESISLMTPGQVRGLYGEEIQVDAISITPIPEVVALPKEWTSPDERIGEAMRDVFAPTEPAKWLSPEQAIQAATRVQIEAMIQQAVQAAIETYTRTKSLIQTRSAIKQKMELATKTATKVQTKVQLKTITKQLLKTNIKQLYKLRTTLKLRLRLPWRFRILLPTGTAIAKGVTAYGPGKIWVKQGFQWYIFESPWLVKDMTAVKKPPPEAMVLEGTPQETFGTWGQIPFNTASWDLGVEDVYLYIKTKILVYKGEGEKTDVGPRDPKLTKGIEVKLIPGHIPSKKEFQEMILVMSTPLIAEFLTQFDTRTQNRLMGYLNPTARVQVRNELRKFSTEDEYISRELKFPGEKEPREPRGESRVGLPETPGSSLKEIRW